jgi:hypothetical protein
MERWHFFAATALSSFGPIPGDFASVHSIGTVRSGGAATAVGGSRLNVWGRRLRRSASNQMPMAKEKGCTGPQRRAAPCLSGDVEMDGSRKGDILLFKKENVLIICECHKHCVLRFVACVLSATDFDE